jgi:hypothetical protein
VLVLEPVEDPLASLPGRNDSRKPEFREVLGDRGWRLLDQLSEVVDGLFPVPERQDQSDASGVRQHCEYLDGEFDELAVGLASANLLICIHLQIISRNEHPDHEITTMPPRSCAPMTPTTASARRPLPSVSTMTPRGRRTGCSI